MESKYLLYKSLLPSIQDKYGFILYNDCDSLLFSGLVGCIEGIDVKLDAAFDSNTNLWSRRPLNYSPCFDCQYDISLWQRIKNVLGHILSAREVDMVQITKVFENGGSSISRDMLLGLAWYCYFNKRLDITEQVIRYALTHCLIMGKGTPTRTLITPGLLSTYAWISYRLGGPSRPWLRYIPQSENKSAIGFEAHLSVLHILLRNMITNKDNYKELLEFHANREPMNALFQAAADRVDKVDTILNIEKLFPSNRLPTASDRAAPWLWERDYNNSDWGPDSTSQAKNILYGADFIFVYALTYNKFKPGV